LAAIDGHCFIERSVRYCLRPTSASSSLQEGSKEQEESEEQKERRKLEPEKAEEPEHPHSADLPIA
jgi:hypothetical protein